MVLDLYYVLCNPGGMALLSSYHFFLWKIVRYTIFRCRKHPKNYTIPFHCCNSRAKAIINDGSMGGWLATGVTHCTLFSNTSEQLHGQKTSRHICKTPKEVIPAKPFTLIISSGLRGITLKLKQTRTSESHLSFNTDSVRNCNRTSPNQYSSYQEHVCKH